MYVVVSPDLSGKEQCRKVAVGRVVTSGSLGGVMVRTLAWNARDVGSIPALGTIFRIFITFTTLVALTMILNKLCAVLLLNLSLYIYKDRFNNNTAHNLLRIMVRATSVVNVMKMRNIVPSAGIEPTSLAFQASVLTITPPRLPDVTTLPTATFLHCSLPERSGLTTTYIYIPR